MTKTTAVGIAKLLIALIYVGVKLSHGKPISEEDMAILGLAGGGFLGNWFSADAKAEPK